jgi:hypothetical protein
MKKSVLITTIMMMFFISFVGYSQSNNKVISLDTAGLPSSSVKSAITQKLQNDAVDQKIAQYGKWAGMGKEIGIATKEGLTAIKDVAVDLSNSNLGKTVMFLIVWKVAGIDFVRIALTLLLAIIGTYLVSKSYFRSFSSRRLVSKSGFFLWPTKTYQPVDLTTRFNNENGYNSYSNRANAQLMHAVIWFAILGVCALVAFV